jgi:hypothetical protein
LQSYVVVCDGAAIVFLPGALLTAVKVATGLPIWSCSHWLTRHERDVKRVVSNSRGEYSFETSPGKYELEGELARI